MLIQFALFVAMAAPERSADVLEVGDGSVSSLVVSADGSLVAGISGSGAFVVDVERWVVHDASACSAQGVALVPNGSDTEVFLGCVNGTVQGHVFTDGSLSDLTVDGESINVELDDGEVQALYYDDLGDRLVAISFGGGNENRLNAHLIDLDKLALTGTSAQFVVDDFTDAAYSNGAIYVAHTGDDISTLIVGNDTPTLNATGNLGINVSADALIASNAGVYAADTSGGRIAEYQGVQWAQTINQLDGPTALALSVEEEWLLVSDKNRIELFDAPSGVATPSELGDFSIGEALTDAVAGTDGYAFGGNKGGGLHVLTAAPWITKIEVAPASAVDGDVLTISFKSDEDGAYKVLRGGTRAGNGKQLDKGDLVAGEAVIKSLTIDSKWSEGTNDVYILVTDTDGNVGHAVASVVVDNPPEAPSLADKNLGFSNRALTLAFDSTEDADIDHYDVFVSITPFDPEDFGTGEAPEFDGDDELTVPIQADATPGRRVSVRIEPLTNEVTYYVAARAVDAGGQESPMSAVVSGTPRPGFTAADLANDDGGMPCSTSGGVAGTSAVVMTLLAMGRRRWGVMAALAMMVPMTAQAKDGKTLKDKGDMTPQRGSFELRYGTIDLWDARLKHVYGTAGNNVLHMDFGPQLWRVAEMDIGLGFFQELAFTVDQEGEASTDRTMLTWYPLSVGGTARLHIIDEQPLVPFVSYGWDWVLWNQKTDDGAGGKDKVAGAKRGTHWALGGNLLLDTFAPGRASLLEAQSGINDTYVVFEFRSQDIGEAREELSFKGTSYTVGLKFDY
jgi:hypothetical protein